MRSHPTRSHSCAADRPGAAALAIAIDLLMLGLVCGPAQADSVAPNDQVTSRVIVREQPTTSSADIGSLRPGERATYVSTVPYWYQVRLSDGTPGYVSKRWTVILPDAPPTPPAVAYTIYVVDVGTGLALLVEGSDFTLVYDAGSNDDLARGTGNRVLAFVRAVAPALTRIDHVIVSHPHRDHVELLPDLFEAYEIRQVWDPGRFNDICGYRALLTAVAEEPGVAYHAADHHLETVGILLPGRECWGQTLPDRTLVVSCASRITTDPVYLGAGASMTFLHVDASEHGGMNENSLVMRLDLGQRRVLLMGDAEAGGRAAPGTLPSAESIEGKLLACCAPDLRADVLVVGHHGSKTSSRTEFLDTVGAATFLVSSGPTRYGTVVLPDQEVITELEARGQVFRTDLEDGACGGRAAKIGPDADGKAGGCDNIRVTISADGQLAAGYFRTSD